MSQLGQKQPSVIVSSHGSFVPFSDSRVIATHTTFWHIAMPVEEPSTASLAEMRKCPQLLNVSYGCCDNQWGWVFRRWTMGEFEAFGAAEKAGWARNAPLPNNASSSRHRRNWRVLTPNSSQTALSVIPSSFARKIASRLNSELKRLYRFGFVIKHLQAPTALKSRCPRKWGKIIVPGAVITFVQRWRQPCGQSSRWNQPDESPLLTQSWPFNWLRA